VQTVRVCVQHAAPVRATSGAVLTPLVALAQPQDHITAASVGGVAQPALPNLRRSLFLHFPQPLSRQSSLYHLDRRLQLGLCMRTVAFLSGDGILLFQSMTCPKGEFGVGGSIPCMDCAAGYFGPWVGLGAETGPQCAGPCDPGRYSPAGSKACFNCSPGYACGSASTQPNETLCSPGTYSEGGAGVCTPCPPGLYAEAPGSTTSACGGPCPAGFACAAGTSNATGMPCPAGKYSEEGSSMCKHCPAGRYGNVSSLHNSSCSGLCSVGRWGAGGATTADCSGPCDPGHACPAGLTSPSPGREYRCPAGTYSARGQGVCIACPAGRYASGDGAASCPGHCTAGKFCPSNSTQETPYVAVAESYGCCLLGVCSHVTVPTKYGGPHPPRHAPLAR
jgi:hypothetical protein